jgi:predicted DNA-binding transcriptional regulator YafY
VPLIKVKAVLKNHQKEKLELLNESIRLQLPECIKNDFQHLSILQQLISSRSLCKIEYVNNNNQSSERNVEAIGLIFYAFNWHLIAWCHHREEYRDFRVSRIANIKCLDEPFQKKDHIPIGDYMKMLPVNY